MALLDFRKRLVYFYWFNGKGEPLAGEKVVFNLTDDLGFTDENFVGKRVITAVVGTDGRGEALLWCDEDSLVAINWTVQFPPDPKDVSDPNKLPPKPRSFSLAYGSGSPLALGIPVKLGIPAPEETTLLYTAVNAYILTLIADGTISQGGGANADWSDFSASIAASDELKTIDETTDIDQLRRVVVTLLKRLKS